MLAGFLNTVNGNSSGFGSAELLKLAEYCYDEIEMRTLFVHHTVAARSPFIESQSQYNVESGVAGKTACERKAPGSTIELFSSGNLDALLNSHRLKKHFENLLGNIYANIALSKISLIPEDTLPVQFKAATDGHLNAAVQWTGLKDGNWYKLQEDLKNIISTDVANVYTGTSGIVTLPDGSNKFQPLFVNTEQVGTNRIFSY